MAEERKEKEASEGSKRGERKTRRAFASRSYSDNTPRKSSLFSFLPLSLSFSPTLLPSPRRVLQPVAPVLFAIYISCYAPMTNASVVLASRQSRSLQKKRKKEKERKRGGKRKIGGLCPLSAFRERRII